MILKELKEHLPHSLSKVVREYTGTPIWKKVYLSERKYNDGPDWLGRWSNKRKRVYVWRKFL